MTNTRTKLSALAAIVLASGLLTGLSTPAAAEASENCAILVGKAPSDVRQASPVLAEYCSSTSMEDARAHLSAGVLATSLIRIWELPNRKGRNYLFVGNYGTCDSAGYRLTPPTTWWEQNVSAVSKFDRCTRGTFTTRGGSASRTVGLPTNKLPFPVDDNVGRIHVYYG